MTTLPVTAEAARTVGNLDEGFLPFWHAVATVEQLADGPLGVAVAGRHFVVAEVDGAVVAFVDACPHRGFPMSEGAVVAGELQCPYHGYRFAPSGRCTTIPAIKAGTPITARADLVPAAGVAVHLGLVWLAPEDPLLPLPEVPELLDDAFGQVTLGPYTWRAGAALMTENFLDVSHFPFVHAGTFGIESDAVVPPLHIERDGLAFTYGYEHRFHNNAEAARLQGTDAAEQRRTFELTFFPPFGVIARITYHDTGVRTVVLGVSTPLDATTSRFFTIFAGTDIGPDDREAARAFEEKILFEDQLALERYRSPEMVLDLDRQYHTGADRMTVEYRRVLVELLDRPAGR